jgi:ferredoxin-NADP reductase
MAVQYKKLIIKNIKEETKGFKTFVFEDGHGLHYQAGQFITLVHDSGTSEIRRSYSIVSSPVWQEPLSIAVKRIDNGFFSRKLVDHSRVEDQLLTIGPAGFFLLPENLHSFSYIFFFAAGSGIVPIFSLIKTALYQSRELKIFLIYSNASVQDTAFYNELKSWEKKFPGQLHIHFLFSSEADLRRARLNRELMLEFLSISRYDRNKTLFYTCGPEAYMRKIIFLLIEEGFPKENIRKEDFNTENRKLPPRTPPDRSTHLVHMSLYGNLVDFPVTYPDTILQAAKKLKLDLPYSCETGKCGTCAALCISGEVWLSNNEVLTEADLQKGLTLTCTGHPQKGDVLLRIG